MRSVWNGRGTVVERLEGRTLLSGSALSISRVAVGAGTELRINATSLNDRIHLKQTAAGLMVSDRGGSQSLAGQFQSIQIRGGAGNSSIVVDPSVHIDCTLFAGPGRNSLKAGSGNDTLVSIGSKSSTLIGGSGRDSFWTDANSDQRILNLRPDEIAGGEVHRVGAFYGQTAPVTQAAKRARRQSMRVVTLPEPGTTDGSTYQSFSDHPLFGSAGPSANDVMQGQVGDCWYLAVLSSVAKIDPWKIRQSVLDMGDGTYLVQFSHGSSSVFVRVDDRLPATPSGNLDYANFGAQNSIWVAVMEKAYALFHGPTASYSSIDGGWMDEAYAALGATAQSIYSAAGPQALLAAIQQQLAAGKSVTYAANTPADGAPLLAGHAYSVDAVNMDQSGNPSSLRLRNPWGFDGAGSDGSNDGYITVTAQQAYDSLLGVVSAVA
jgi:hypothetical protein